MPAPKVLITGASRGIGRAIAEALSADYRLILHASCENTLPELPGDHTWLYADFSDPEATRSFCARLKSEHGDSLYAVINNAGLTLDKSLVFQPEKDIDKLINVNLKAPILISKTAMKLFLIHKRGVIINMSSCVAGTGNAFQAVYTATKAGLEALAKSLAKEAAALDAGQQIRCLSLAPGFIETDMTQAIPQREKERYKDMIPSGRFGKPDDIAATIRFLLSDHAAYLNGTTIHVNGGMC
jgi:3-oxoacyl-[acyl-carrier protein] reductase